MRKLIIRLLFTGDTLALRTFDLIQKRREAFRLNHQKKSLQEFASKVQGRIYEKEAELQLAKLDYFEIQADVEAAYKLELD